MKTVKEVSEVTGISIRTLRYYDEIGLLKPTALTDANYRLYDQNALERLQQICFFRELEIPLADIKAMLESPNYDRKNALLTQKSLLEHKRNRLNGLIALITDVLNGENPLNFQSFTDEDIQKILDHSLALQADDTKKSIVEKYGSIEAFQTFLTKQMKESNFHVIKLYGSKDKAVEASMQAPFHQKEMQKICEENDTIFRLFAEARKTDNEALAMEAVAKFANASKRMFRLENARYLLLKVAEDYLQTKQCPELIDRTNEQYGNGITEYIGHAIRLYYGMGK